MASTRRTLGVLFGLVFLAAVAMPAQAHVTGPKPVDGGPAMAAGASGIDGPEAAGLGGCKAMPVSYEVSDTEVGVGETIEVMVTVKNTCEEQYTTNAVLLKDGSHCGEKESVTLAAGETRQVTFTTNFSTTGEHTVSVFPLDPTTITVVDQDLAEDTDGDGISDGNDDCPNRAEDTDGIRDGDGCPEEDADGDNVPDEDDGCPLEKEDYDGYKDKDGCPEKGSEDSDGDGIDDPNDDAPNRPEDDDGIQDGDGAPEDDADGDNVPDEEDDCPLHKEDYDGVLDGDGCRGDDEDGDGIPDADDAAPERAEDEDGVEDGDGAPEGADGDGVEDGDGGENDTAQHESGVSQRVFDAVAGEDGDLSRDEVTIMVREYVEDGSLEGVSIDAEAVMKVVRYYAKH